MAETKHILWHKGNVNRGDRERRQQHKAAVFWFTGLSGSGKSTVAHAVEKRLFDMGFNAFVLDGDNVRHGLCSDLCFSPEDRLENLRRIAETAKLFTDIGNICLCAFVSPLRRDRQLVRRILDGDMHEIFVSCSVEVCSERDVKGYYKLAMEGKIKNYTGVSAPYEAPADPDLILKTDRQEVDESVQQVMEYILKTVRMDSASEPVREMLDAG